MYYIQIRRACGFAGQPEVIVPTGGHDGAWLRADRWDHPLLRGLHRRKVTLHQDRQHVPTRQQATLTTGDWTHVSYLEIRTIILYTGYIDQVIFV